MKKAFFTLALLAVVTLLSAQTLQIEHDGYVYGNDETVIALYDEALYEYNHHMQIRNISSQDLNVVVEQSIFETVDDAMISFCWDLCFAPGMNLSYPVAIPANSLSDKEFSTHISIPDGETGVVKVRYYVYDADNPDSKISIVIIAGQTADVAETTLSLGQAYPNPASTQVNFDLQASNGANLDVVVYNLLGQEVKSQLVSGHQNRVKIAVDDLQPGIYFCRFSVDGTVVKTEKFIVKR